MPQFPPRIPPKNRTDLTPSAGNHAGDHNAIAEALDAIVSVLGAAPAGTYADLTSRLLAGPADASPEAIAEFQAARKAVNDLIVRDLGTSDGQLAALLDTPTSQAARSLAANIATAVPAYAGDVAGTAVARSLDKTSRALALDATARADVEYLPATSFAASSGTPSLAPSGGGSRFPVWLLDKDTLEQISAGLLLPAWWTHFWCDLYFTNAGAGTGTVTMSVSRSAVVEGASLTAGDVNAAFTIQAADVPAQDVVKRRRLFSSVTPQAVVKGAPMHMRLSRNGADGADTLGNDVSIIGVTFRRAMPAIKIAADGNSLMAGQGATGGIDALQVTKTLLTEPDTADRVQVPPVLANFAVGGQTTAQMAADAATQIDPTIAVAGTYAAQILLVWEITNALYLNQTMTAQAAFEQYRDYCLARRAAGWRVLSFTVTPRSNSGTPANFEARRQQVNALLRANWPDFADGLVDVAADARLGAPGAETNTTYYGDLVHMTNAGYAVVGGLIASAVQRVIGGN